MSQQGRGMSQSQDDPQQAEGQAPLDDLMLAMDVVDSLRRQQRLVEQELDSGAREAALKIRLQRVYAAQGIEVSDAVLDEGVRALRDDRFVYQPPAPSFAVTLARLYVSRNRWGKWLLGAWLALLLLVGAWILLVVMPNQVLPNTLKARHAEVRELAGSERVNAQADQLLAAARQALDQGETGLARDLLTQLEQLRDQLAVGYQIRVVNRPGVRSGVWRIPEANPEARNYYLVVEAIDAGGRRVAVPVRSEETGETKRVERWGLRVDRATFERVAADKGDDGIIQDDLLGAKAPGELEPRYSVPSSGAAITDW
ncbi:MAG: DUF6384 family protein [Lamprobacter sp.]|uniref:DUF6384 family protein n=1 Tax=Lamprobacter sp. TaxID=3100796 RepID=UPI002B26314E|nr:DUF6384 family protein [Lamprobacter sp.]MEA3640413.1 DUF6384 family protein [Lamprobacter sp.]